MSKQGDVTEPQLNNVINSLMLPEYATRMKEVARKCFEDSELKNGTY